MHSRHSLPTVLSSAAVLIVTSCSTSAQPSRQYRQPAPARVVGRWATTRHIERSTHGRCRAHRVVRGAKLAQALTWRGAALRGDRRQPPRHARKRRRAARRPLVERSRQGTAPTEADVRHGSQPCPRERRVTDQVRDPSGRCLPKAHGDSACLLHQRRQDKDEHRCLLSLTVRVATGQTGAGSGRAPSSDRVFRFPVSFCQRANPTVNGS